MMFDSRETTGEVACARNPARNSPLQNLLRVQSKLFAGGRSGYGGSRDGALRVTGDTGKSFERPTRCKVCDFERHEILGAEADFVGTLVDASQSLAAVKSVKRG
jgi:hypothetical protein